MPSKLVVTGVVFLMTFLGSACELLLFEQPLRILLMNRSDLDRTSLVCTIGEIVIDREPG